MSSSSPPPVIPRDWRTQIDLLIRLILTSFFALWATSCFQSAAVMIRQMDFHNLQAAQIGQLLSVLSIGLFTIMSAVVYAVRLKPATRFPGLVPATVAVAGGFLMLTLTLFHRATLPLWAQGLAATLVVAGYALSAVIILRLGKSFSIIPEGRRLVTTGPYAIVRHPLYLAEALATAGLVINYWSVWAVCLFALQLALQLARIHYEEQVLRGCFPDYDDYARRTRRLIPGIY